MDISDNFTKMEADDCINIGAEVPCPSKYKMMENGLRCVGLMDLSDDVLLYILQHCTPRDLKALGYTCERLGNLVRDHTLWQRVDARDYPSGVERIKWLLIHVLNSGTKELLLSGFARNRNHYLKNTNGADIISGNQGNKTENNITAINTSVRENYSKNINKQEDQQTPTAASRQHARLHYAARQLPRCTRSPFSEDSQANNVSEDCPEPQFTFTQPLFKELKSRCPNLVSLSLEYCHINNKTTGISHFPPTLKKLSLRGVQYYNLFPDKSVLFNIHCHLPELEYLDLSECSWLEPLCMLTLSKIPNLKHLLMRDCMKMREFVAYASLATRYGFFKLQILDLRGTPVGDSEVSAFGWLPELQELYLSPCRNSTPNSEKNVESTNFVSALESWELEEPDYYKLKYQEHQELDVNVIENDTDMKNKTWTATDSPNTSAKSNMPTGLLVEVNDRPIGCDLKRKLDASSSVTGNQQHGQPKKRKKYTENDDIMHITHENEPNPSMNNSAEDNDHPQTLENNKLDVDKITAPEVLVESSDNNNDKNELNSSEANRNQENDRLSIYFKSCRCTNDDSNNIEPSSSNVGFGIVINNSEENSHQVIEPSDKSECNSNDLNNHDQPSTSHSNEDSNNTNGGIPPNVFKDYTPILYVNLGSRRTHYLTNNDRYRLISLSHNNAVPGLLDLSLHQAHIDPAALVTDAAIRRFGRADGDVNLTFIAQRDDNVIHNSRPDRSNLRILSATGYRDITSRSLVHLATAAPHLRLIDFSGTRVTASDVETFRSLRPDCEVIFSDDND